MGARLAGADALFAVGEGVGGDGGDGDVFFQHRNIDFVERVGLRVIIEHVVRGFLIRNERWHSFQQEIEMVSAGVGVEGEIFYAE